MQQLLRRIDDETHTAVGRDGPLFRKEKRAVGCFSGPGNYLLYGCVLTLGILGIQNVDGRSCRIFSTPFVRYCQPQEECLLLIPVQR